MTYLEIQIGSHKAWTAQPSNWDELSWTLHNEEPFLNYNPLTTAPPDPNEELMKKFLL